jgi:glycosyltransferase involved in cell wall biosynthesis
MKILLLNDEFYTTGASTAVLRLAERLVVDHEVMVMPRIDGQGDIREKLEALNIPIVPNAQGVDVVIANTLMAGELVAQAALRCPVIWWIHEAEVGRNMLLRYPQLAAGFDKATHIVFQTEYQKMVYGSMLFDSQAQVHVLPFWNDAIYRQTEFHITPTHQKRIVCIGTIEPRKRMEDTVFAVDAMEENLKANIECVFIGKYIQLGPEAKALVDAHPQRYQFLGEQPNHITLSYLASADAFVLASSSESQPLSIWEAFELEVPVCLSALETYRHIGLSHGRHALMHQIGSIDMLSANLRLILTSASLKKTITKAAKGLLLSRLANDWGNEFLRIIGRADTYWKIKQLGY